MPQCPWIQSARRAGLAWAAVRLVTAHTVTVRHRRPMRCCSSSRTRSWNGVEGRAVTTWLVMMASTLCSMVTPPLWPLLLQSLQAVVGGVLVGLTEGGEVEGPVDEGVDRLAGGDGGPALVDELPGELVDDVGPEQAMVVAPKDQLDQPLGGPGDLGPGTVLKPRPPHLAVDARRFGRLLGHPDHGGLGDGVDAVGGRGS